jgi:hypothetical protein
MIAPMIPATGTMKTPASEMAAYAPTVANSTCATLANRIVL